MQLSAKAIEDLKSELINKYGSAFDLSNDEINEIGSLVLVMLAESLKNKMP